MAVMVAFIVLLIIRTCQPTWTHFIQAPVHLQQGLNFSKQRGSDVANLKEFQVITDVTAFAGNQR